MNRSSIWMRLTDAPSRERATQEAPCDRPARPGDRLGLATASTDLVTAAVFCVLLAAFLALAAPMLAPFPTHLLYAECIGLSVVGLGLALTWLPGFERLPRSVRAVGTLALALPGGYILGRVIASGLPGESGNLLEFGGGRVAGVLATVLGSAFVGDMLVTRAKLAAEERARQQVQQLATESQLPLLRAQLDPHMLFNTLANLHALVDDDPTQAKAMIDRLITFLRSALAGSRSEASTLEHEFSQLEAYLGLMRMRLGARLTCRLELPAELAMAGIPPMLLQALVENAVRHGIEPKIGAGCVVVRARADARAIEVTVIDDGVGLPASTRGDERVGTLADESVLEPARAVVSDSGYGLVHVRQRLAALFGEGATLRLEAAVPGPGTVATVTITV